MIKDSVLIFEIPPVLSDSAQGLMSLCSLNILNSHTCFLCFVNTWITKKYF